MKIQRCFGNHCYNPFAKDRHSSSSGLRTISANLKNKYANIPREAKLCASCRKEMSSLSSMSPLQEYESMAVNNDSELFIIGDESENAVDIDDSTEDELYLPPSSQKSQNAEEINNIPRVTRQTFH
ncbi:uncharacterized protein LOC118753958 [Rhagoletis pomonella]|uniref:uncharacterized protein LOC118752889 n=1 Tax=Rhagoletis pomonella TaxID=28610 RepID=UPI00177B4BD1|nr:uncharacterized protein LOC118752889 [Rhagoletis pomonella]XP_036344723.1 uncharacterized protein LOC118753958 [Rhagoletis pomonella]